MTEAEAYLAQLEMDEASRKKDKFFHLAVAALVGFAAGRITGG